MILASKTSEKAQAKKRLGILDFRILEFLAQGYDFTLTSAMMPALNYWSSLITFC
ncbi:hypothetical protein [Campylobacter magnus]|uniref:Uncharacterized protein n=1 Tax=Campylobacter magnus TaxID=3026462 RepID=A0ABT8T8K5_9BACT|nr:hypothetical protein [Campylobacter magnus]MDO2410054.1 hypothetical protein [Campylobacter magnus]